MEASIIEFLLAIVCILIFTRGVLYPLSKLTKPIVVGLTRLIFPLLEKSQLEKQQEALKQAKERIKLAEIQKETIQAEKRAMRIQDSIIDEEFAEIDEKFEKTKS